MKHRYTVVLDKDSEGAGYTVTVPASAGCVTEGDTVQDSLNMAREATEGHLEALAALGRSPAADIQEVQIDVGDADEILIYKVDIELEPDLVQAITD